VLRERLCLDAQILIGYHWKKFKVISEDSDSHLDQTEKEKRGRRKNQIGKGATAEGEESC